MEKLPFESQEPDRATCYRRECLCSGGLAERNKCKDKVWEKEIVITRRLQMCINYL